MRFWGRRDWAGRLCGKWGFVGDGLMMLRVGGVGLEAKEPSVATILTSFENSFDMYGALSTPLYQTATFKQVIWNFGFTWPQWGTKSINVSSSTIRLLLGSTLFVSSYF